MADRKSKQKMSFQDLKKMFKTDVYYNYPNNFVNEGEDHINLSGTSSTFIGKLFAPEYLKTVKYPHLGKFASVMSLWYWVRSEKLDDTLRRLTGFKLRGYIKATDSYGNYTPNFKAIIGYATWLKVRTYREAIKELKELDTNKIKFLSYTKVRDSGVRISNKFAPMLIEIAREITQAVKEDREPNFDAMCDKPEVAGLHYVEGVLTRIFPLEKIEEMKLEQAKKPAGSEDEEFELSSPEPVEEIQAEGEQTQGS